MGHYVRDSAGYAQRAFAAAKFGAVSRDVKYGSALNGSSVNVSVASLCVCASTCALMACMHSPQVIVEQCLQPGAQRTPVVSLTLA